MNPKSLPAGAGEETPVAGGWAIARDELALRRQQANALGGHATVDKHHRQSRLRVVLARARVQAAAALALLITAACSAVLAAGEWIGSRHERHLHA